MTLTLIREPHKKLYRRLAQKKVSHLSLIKGLLRFRWNDRWYRKAVRTPKRLPWVGAHQKAGRSVSVQRDLALKNHRYEILIAVHETVEGAAEILGLPRNREAHVLATKVEKELARRLHVRWDIYNNYVEVEFRLQRRKQ